MKDGMVTCMVSYLDDLPIGTKISSVTADSGTQISCSSDSTVVDFDKGTGSLLKFGSHQEAREWFSVLFRVHLLKMPGSEWKWLIDF